MALTFDAFINPPDFDKKNLTALQYDSAMEGYGLSFGFAVMIATSLTMVSIMLIVNLHTLVHDEDVIGYLLEFGHYRIVLLVLVTALAITTLCGISVTAKASYPPRVFTGVVALGTTSVTIVLAALVSQVKFTKAATAARLSRVKGVPAGTMATTTTMSMVID